jgi:hypothetical protein
VNSRHPIGIRDTAPAETSKRTPELEHGETGIYGVTAVPTAGTFQAIGATGVKNSRIEPRVLIGLRYFDRNC